MNGSYLLYRGFIYYLREVVMKAILTSAVILLFAVSTAVSAGEPVEKKTRKIVRTETKSEGAWLGVALGNYASKSSDEKKSAAKEGAIVEEVIDHSPADSVGLKEDDIIVELNGTSVGKAEDVVTRVGAMKPGEKATVVVMRDDAKKTFTVVLGSRPEMRRRVEMRMPRMELGNPGMEHGFMMNMERHGGVEGMQLMELHDQLGKYFEAPDGKALLVTEVKKNSNARKAGIEAGDVITKVGTTDIEDMGDLHEALKDAKEGTSVDVAIIRKGAHKTVKLDVSARDDRMMMNFRNGFPGQMDLQMGNFNIDREQLREMMKDLKPELDKIKKEIRIRTRVEGANAPVEIEEESSEGGTEL
jgi:C-terminal processing protease CtpA/Prc